MKHILKTWNEHFENVWNGVKTFELRLNDRNYQVGDTLVLREYEPNDNVYSGRELICRVSHILPCKSFFIDGGDYVILSIVDVVRL